MPKKMESIVNEENLKRLAAGILGLAICLILVFPCYTHFGNAENRTRENTYLDETRADAMKLAAALSGASILIAAVPGDATTPVADEVAHMNDYVLLSIGAISLEKLLLIVLSRVSFRFLFPAAVVFAVLFYCFRRKAFRVGAVYFLMAGIVFFWAIPTAIWIGHTVDKAYGFSGVVDRICEDIDKLDLEKANDATSAKERTNDDSKGSVNGSAAAAAGSDRSAEKDREDETPSIKNFLERLTGLGEDVKENVTAIEDSVKSNLSNNIEKVKTIPGNLIDAVAALLITSCVIPIITMLFVLWVSKLCLTTLLDAIGGRDPS